MESEIFDDWCIESSRKEPYHRQKDLTRRGVYLKQFSNRLVAWWICVPRLEKSSCWRGRPKQLRSLVPDWWLILSTRRQTTHPSLLLRLKPFGVSHLVDFRCEKVDMLSEAHLHDVRVLRYDRHFHEIVGKDTPLREMENRHIRRSTTPLQTPKSLWRDRFPFWLRWENTTACRQKLRKRFSDFFADKRFWKHPTRLATSLRA